MTATYCRHCGGRLHRTGMVANGGQPAILARCASCDRLPVPEWVRRMREGKLPAKEYRNS
jgi:hypothetical protein